MDPEDIKDLQDVLQTSKKPINEVIMIPCYCGYEQDINYGNSPGYDGEDLNLSDLEEDLARDIKREVIRPMSSVLIISVYNVQIQLTDRTT